MLSIDRVKSLLLSPRTEWPRIESESDTVQGVVRNWLVWLVAIPAIATFIGFSLFGVGAFGVRVRVPVVSGLVNAVLSVVLGIVMVGVIAKIAEVLAPKFGGQGDYLRAFKLIAYGSTAAMVAGVVYLLPMLAPLAILGALYSIWLLYVGVPVMMRVPEGRALPYTAILIVCGWIAGVLIGLIGAAVVPSPAPMAGGDVKISTPKGEVSIDTGKLEAMAKKMEEASKQMEQASKSGDGEAMGKAAGAVLGALFGAGERKPIDSATLKATLPETLADLPRGRWETGSGTTLGIDGSRASAEYGEGARRLSVEIVDVGGLSGLMQVAGWAATMGDRETNDEVEKTYRDGKRIVQEKARRNGSSSEYRVVLANGVMVEARGTGVDLASLKRAVERLDLGRLERSGSSG